MLGKKLMTSQINNSGQILLYKDECYAIQGAVFEVYKEIGSGFLEAVYQECLSKELASKNVPFKCQPDLILNYKGEPLSVVYRPDFICYEKIIVEIKAVQAVGVEHRMQVLNYLKGTGLRLGLLVNFGHYPKATIERIIL